MTNYNCDICKFTSINKANYTKHLHTKTHIEKITPENKFCCDICLKIFSYKNNLYKHKKKCSETYYDNDISNNDNIDNNDNNDNNDIAIIKDPTITILLLQQEIKFLKEKTEIESKLIKEKTENKLLQKQSKNEKKLLNEHKKELLKSKDEQIDLV
jgi:hypothetical protein